MNWEQIEAYRQEMAGQVQSEWAKLGGEDIQYGAFKKMYSEGEEPARSGILKSDPGQLFDEWIAM